MKQWPELKPAVWDLLVAAVVLALALGCGARVWLGGSANEDLVAVVSMDGQEVERFAPSTLLQAPKVYSNHGYTLTVICGAENVSASSAEKSDGAAGICVAVSDCPTQDCVHTGTISRSGQSIVCLPARIVIQLVGGSEPGLDAVLG